PAAGAAPPVARHALCRGFGVWKIAVNALTSRITLDRAAGDYTSVRQIRRRVDRLLRFVAERASQHLADIGFWQLGAELDMLRHFVAGQALVAEITHFLLGQILSARYHKRFHDFAGMLVANADHRTFEDVGMPTEYILDFAGEDL